VDVTLVEGAVANMDNLRLAQELRARSRIVVSFGDCAVTGNVPTLRNKLGVDDLLTAVYHEGPGKHPIGGEDDGTMPRLLPGCCLCTRLSTWTPFYPAARQTRNASGQR